MLPAGNSKSKRSVRIGETRHCEEHLRRSNPALLCGILDCFAVIGRASRDPLARNDGSGYAASDAICALMILSGSFTGSPRLILSTFSMPEVTLPHTVYWLLRKEASSKQMKNWLSPESGLAARAIDVVPRTCGSLLNSALSFLPEPPVPVPCGHPVCAMKPSMTRWNTMPS